MEVVASLYQGRTAAAQCGLFTYKSIPVIFEAPCITIGYEKKHAVKQNYGRKRVYLMSSVKSNRSRDAGAVLAKFNTTFGSGNKKR